MRSRRIVQRLPPRLRASHENRPGRSCAISLRRARGSVSSLISTALPIGSLSNASTICSVLVAGASDRASSVTAAGSIDGHTSRLRDGARRRLPGARARARGIRRVDMSIAFKDTDIVVLAGARTPFGNLGGALSGLTATDLAVAAAEAAIERSGVAREVDRRGRFRQRHSDERRRDLSGPSRRLARRLADRRPRAHREPALRLRPSGDSLRRAIARARQRDVRARRRRGEHEPGAARRARRAQGVSSGPERRVRGFAVDRARSTRTATRRWRSPPRISRRSTASRARSATSSRSRVKSARLQAQSSGYFAEEIVPVEVPGPKGATTLVEKDEGPRTGLTMEKLGKLAGALRRKTAW